MKTAVHFTENSLLNPTNPIVVNLIGAGGTGSQVLTALARINHSLLALQHPGLFVRVFDADEVSPANLGRQLFAEAEVGLNKAVALINRLNRFFGTNWKAVPYQYNKRLLEKAESYRGASITISCVDSAKARFEIAELLCSIVKPNYGFVNNQPLYWLDFGNSRHTGQVVLATVQQIRQPKSELYEPVGNLPLVTDEFKSLLLAADDNNEPSCSLAEALTKQDLFINSALANMGASLLWSMFREGLIENRGFFLNLKEFRTTPIKITAPAAAVIAA